MKNIRTLISGNYYLNTNKKIAHEIGLVPATIFGELFHFFTDDQASERTVTRDGKEWVACTIEQLESETTIKKDTQAKALKLLEQKGFIKTKGIGLPRKRHFTITKEGIEKWIG